MIRVSAEPEGIGRAAEAIRAGKLVAYPTETVYGLGVDPFSPQALERLYNAKRRDGSKAVLLVVNGREQLAQVVADVSPRAAAFIEAFWPGPLSLLLPKSPSIPDALTGGRAKVCVRCPGCRIARELCGAVGTAITSTSANVSGERPARSLDEVHLEGVAIGIDGGSLADGPASTVFDPDLGTILRAGAVSEANLACILPGVVKVAREGQTD